MFDLIKTIENRVKSQTKNLRKAIFGSGEYHLADTHEQFSVCSKVWANKTDNERERHFKKLRCFLPKSSRIAISGDGQSQVVLPRTHDKKIGKVKRKRTERTVTIKKTEKIN